MGRCPRFRGGGLWGSLQGEGEVSWHSNNMAQQPQKEEKKDKEVREQILVQKVALCLGLKTKTAQEKLRKSLLENEDSKSAILNFMVEENYMPALFISQTGAETALAQVETPHPDKLKKKWLVILRVGGHVEGDDIQDSMVAIEITKNLLEHLHLFFSEVISPVIQNKDNQAGWSDLVTKDLMERFNAYVAQVYVMMGLTKGRTMLPLPSKKMINSDGPEKEKAHIFEMSIMTWTKQIKNILKQEPEQALKAGGNPGPHVEIQFWENKAANLNSIYEQLQSVEVKGILRFLERSKSTYTNPFTKLQKEVQQARVQANDNAKFLSTLKDFFQKFRDPSFQFIKLSQIFAPMMHNIYLIYKHSGFYKTPTRLVVLIREICNAIITKAYEYINGEMVSSMIGANETAEACERLQNTIEIGVRFKEAYFEYKAKSNGEWKLTLNALFVRLDLFVERCHDIHHLTSTILQFNKLERIELGGTKGYQLTETIKQIHSEFHGAVEAFKSLPYDTMNINEKTFDDDFFNFRSKIKELERRLASVITQGFDDNDTLTGKFRLLESFEIILNRPIIQDELEKKHMLLLDMYKQDLKAVQAIFIEGKNHIEKNDEKAPIYNGYPPVAGTLSWCKALTDRITEPYDRIPSLGPGITEREDYNDVQKLYSSIIKSIKEYEEHKNAEWQKEIEQNTEDKLKHFLFYKDEAGVLKVNFDPALVRLLREVKYMKQLHLDVVKTAEEMFAKAHTFRRQTVSLDLIAQNYNKIINCLEPVEEPLVKKRIDAMDKQIEPGITTLRWKSADIDGFIAKSKEVVDNLYEIVEKMKKSLESIDNELKKFKRPFMEKKNKAIPPEEYDSIEKVIFQKGLDSVKEASSAIHKQLKEVSDAVKADRKSIEWRNYTEYINTIVIDGIANAITFALSHLNDQITCRNKDVSPLFQIKMELDSRKGVIFEPEIAETYDDKVKTVRGIIRGWVNDIVGISFNFQRLDTVLMVTASGQQQTGDFLIEAKDDFNVRVVTADITHNLIIIEKECTILRNELTEKYAYLWKEDPNHSFQNFLKENEPKEVGEVTEEAIDTAKENPLLKGCRERIPDLEIIDGRITNLKQIQQEVQRIKSPEERYWLRIDLKSFTKSLESHINKWIEVYNEFLLNEFKNTLRNTKEFIARTNDGIKVNPAEVMKGVDTATLSEHQKEKNRKLLMDVMKTISEVKDVEGKFPSVVDRMKSMVLKLKKHNVSFKDMEEEPMQAIETVVNRYSETSKKVYIIKGEILHLQNLESIEIKKKLDEFGRQVDQFRVEYKQNLPYYYDESWDLPTINENYKTVDRYYEKLRVFEQKQKDYAALEKLFETERRQYKPLKECLQDLKNLKVMWDLISIINYQYQDWKGKLWRQIKADVLIEQNKLFVEEIKRIPKEIKSFKGYANIQEKVNNMNMVLTAVDLLLQGTMEERHWKQLKERTRSQFDEKSPTFTFDDVLALKLHKYVNEVTDIVDVASKEDKNEKKLKIIENFWSKQNFLFETYKEMYIFAPLDNMVEALDAHSLEIMGMKAQGKYIEFFKDAVDNWRERLGRVYTVVDEWLKVQKNWRILVNIFMGSEDIRMQLPEDTKIFEGVNTQFVEMMTAVHDYPLVIEACTEARKETLIEMSQKIKKCEKALNDYLEQKKKMFPRFYFLSNQSLLTILSNGQNPPKVAEFIGDCFDGLKTLRFMKCDNPNEIQKFTDGMYSKDDEFIEFNKHAPHGTNSNFVCEGRVEEWLKKLQEKMREVLYLILCEARNSTESWDSQGSDKPREEWVKDWCAQIALLTTQIVWTEEVAKAFDELGSGNDSAMRECCELIINRINKLIMKVTEPLDILDRLKIINIITIDVHSRDVVQNFITNKVSEVESFAWQSQLKFDWNVDKSGEGAKQFARFYWEQDPNKSKCIIKIVDWYRFYSFEYVGNSVRLVITPLTDRCYITLTQALNLTMGGAPAGPAGTGKTETTKDLGRAVGLPVMVFNCSDQMNKDSMAQIFMGLAQSGAWGCFDEFNRISIEVLSVVSTQVKTCLDALKEKKRKFVFMEEGEINLEDTVGFFITMNPGYAGRTQLPQNLKALFRSCAMVVPDLVLICENMLMSEGFVNAKELSKKFVSLYMLSRELLSKQRHYDWGLRAVKSVLRQAGKLRREDKELAQDPLLMRALRDFNLPKIVTDDKSIFQRLIADLFPGAEAPSKKNPQLSKCCKEAIQNDVGFCHEDVFQKKCIQMSQILEVRHCMFVIGPPGSGKTSVWKTLQKTHLRNKEECEIDTLNPKAVTSDDLFGCYTKTKEWKNGVLAVIMKNQNKCEEKYKPNQKHKWSILDGDIDPEWIESLNTVMDDNKVLTLVSNDRIPLSPSMRLIFEISNLKNATPATVSRGGVLFINETDIGWIPYMNSWLERKQLYMNQDPSLPTRPIYPKLDQNAVPVFLRCFQSYIEPNPSDIHDTSKMIHIVPHVLMGAVQTICAILDGLLEENQAALTAKQNAGQDEELKQVYQAFFLFAGMWAFGGSVGGGQDDEKAMKDFNIIWRSISKIKYPDSNSCFDFFWSVEEMKWVNWSNRIESYSSTDETIFSKIYVNTIHTTRLKHLLHIHLNRRKPALFVGGAGTGKTAVVRDFLSSTSPVSVLHKTINFSSFTDSKSLQRQIQSMLEKKSGKTYGSATNRVIIAFIDDLNMPYVDKYGTQSPIQLLRQIIDYGSIFNMDQLEERKFIQDLLFFSCLNQKSGSFIIDLRLQRYFSVFAMNTPSQETIKTIFGSILGEFFKSPGWDLKTIPAVGDKLIESLITVFQKVLKNNQFSPSAKKFHYQFNYRELAKVVEGIMRSSPVHYRNQFSLLKLWNHEMRRVFEDRLINKDDILLFRSFVKEGVVKSFGQINEKENPLEEPCLFSNLVSEYKNVDHCYLAVEVVEELKKALEEKLQQYNNNKAEMDLVLFEQAMEHIVKIHRIITLPSGNCLLVGVGGSGKQSLAKLACFICNFQLDQMLVTQNFGMSELRNFLNEKYKKAAKPNSLARVFILNDSQIKEESFLIPINDMLNSGWISDIVTKEEFENMVSGLRNEAKGLGVPDTQETLTQYFLDKMKKNLKVILCFSPVGDTMRIRSRKFPGIINSTSIDWFHPWPRDALINVANRFLIETRLESELIDKISNNMAETHISIDIANERFRKYERRNNYTTPKSFLELINFYKGLLKVKQEMIENQISKYNNGLKILAETKSQVEGLQEKLKVKMVDVEKKRVETDKLIEKVSTESAIASDEQAKANIEEEKTNKKSEEAKQVKEISEHALNKALPTLRSAESAAMEMKKNALVELKSMKTPPEMTYSIMKAVMIILGEKVSLNEANDKFWPRAQNYMNNPDRFKQNLIKFVEEKATSIDQAIIDTVKKITTDPRYTRENAKTCSDAAEKLFLWSVNILDYNRIFKEVAPLQAAERKASEQLAIAQKQLARVKEDVRKLNEKVDALRKQLMQAEEEKRIVQEDAQNCQNKLTAAEKLVNGLAGENKRWSINVNELRNNKRSIIGDVLLASQFVSYIGAFSVKLRLDLWKGIWLPDIFSKEIPITDGIEPLKILTNESIKAKWKIEGLPADTMSLENAAIITSCSRWPLLIDPQLQGSNWIRGAQQEKLVTINISQKHWLREVNRCISEGKSLLLEGIQEDIDATLQPLLTRSINKKSANWTIDIAGTEVDYDKEFKLFLMTKMFNPHFRPEIAAQCTIINFIVTENGLEEQLLASVVNVEKNELENQKQNLVKLQNQFQMELDRLESELLTELDKADPTTILDNKELIEKLDITKKTAIDIQKQSEEAKITELKINTEREIYRAVAIEGAYLYFLIISLCIVDHMYQYSLESFNTFFFKAIEKVVEQDESRIQKLYESIRINIYQWVSRGLFERHKLIFLTLITFRLMQKQIVNVVYTYEELDFLVKGAPKPGTENNLDWLPNIAWDMVQSLVQLEEFKLFAQNLEKDAPTRFKDWYNELTPEDAKLPLDWKKLDSQPFRKLLVIKCLRPDRITIALSRFIRDNLPKGEEFVDMDSKIAFVDVLSSALEDSDPSIPIFFILSPGTDPVKDVEAIIKRDKDKRRIEPGKSFFNIALGQGQDEIARRRLEEGNKEGHWIMLQNIHLMPRWLLELEKILDGYKGEANSHPNFRLLLSAEPSLGVPIGILDRSIKLTNEPPSGLKANMKRAFTYFSSDEINDKDNKTKAIFFGLCFFHSTVIQRRRFGPKGWNMQYPFSMGDLRDSYLVLNRYMESNTSKPFEDLIYIFGEIMYGGHIVDDWDRRLARAYLENIMVKEIVSDDIELFPYIEGKNLSFRVPAATTCDKYIEYIDQTLTQESPLAYGLHPNAEIGFRTNQCHVLFNTLIELQPKDKGSAEGGGVRSSQEILQELVKRYLEDINLKSLIFNVEDLKNRVDPDTRGPYQNVFIQEVEYMAILLIEIVKSLEEIDQGVKGNLTISEKMEQTMDSLQLNRVPQTWANLSYPSKRGLESWITNLIKRHAQLDQFKEDPLNLPKIIMISRFFNPQSYLTAIKQVVAANSKGQGLELNKLYIQTQVWRKSIEEIDVVPKDGAFVYGFILEGASWDVNACQLEESKPKQMFVSMPAVFCRAALLPAEGKEDKNLYQCPAYKTEDRGNTYVFTAQLKTKAPPRKWILAGVAIIMDVEGISDQAIKKKDDKDKK